MQYYYLLQLQYTIIITKALNHLYKLTNPLQITIIFNLYTDAFLQWNRYNKLKYSIMSLPR